jgi:quercetin dioxygenase-like cupin family protein
VVKGSNMMFTWFEVPPHQLFPEHSHESEQITYVLEGELFFEIADEIFCLRKGDCISIPPYKKHRVWTETKGARAVDSWSPINNTY